MFANVGLVQLNYGFTEKEVLNIIDSVNADGLFIHLNHMQVCNGLLVARIGSELTS